MTYLPALLRTGLAVLGIGACLVLQAQPDGAPKWAFATLSSFTQGNILSSPSVAPDGSIYIGVEIGSSTATNPSGKLFALTASGTKKWEFTTPEWIDSSPAIGRDGTIYFGCWDGNLYALNPDGSLKWKLSLGAFVSASPAIGADGTVYIGAGNGNFCAVDPNGTLKWIFPALYWIESAPAIAPDGTIYFGSDDNNVYAIRPDGTEKWHHATGNDVVSSPAIGADGTVYIGSRDLKLYAFTPAGAVKWTFQTADMIDASPVLAADGTVYFGTTGGRLFALRPDGTEKWRYPAATQTALSSIYSTPAVRSDGSIVFGTSDNLLYALRPDGTLLWRAAMGDWADSSPAVTSDGTIYIGCTDKNLYAFHSTTPALMTEWPQLLRNPQRTGAQVFGTVAGTPGRLTNLSVRTLAGSDANTLIVGFAIGGSGSRDVLVRGVGPTLTGFGVGGVLSDPKITFYAGQTVSASNDQWWQSQNAAIVASTAPTVGAFPLPPGSFDAALLSTFSPGGQTVHVSGANGSTGIALLELYDAAGSSTARLTNVAARSLVGTGGSVLIAGFAITSGPRAVLVRGVGPALANYGVGGVLANPRLRVYDSRQVLVAESDNWSIAINAAAIASVSDSVGAFPLANGSTDASFLLTLPPGSYTAQVSGVNDTTGVGLVEVYEVP